MCASERARVREKAQLCPQGTGLEINSENASIKYVLDQNNMSLIGKHVVLISSLSQPPTVHDDIHRIFIDSYSCRIEQATVSHTC